MTHLFYFELLKNALIFTFLPILTLFGTLKIERTCQSGQFLGINVFHTSRRSCFIILGSWINSYVGKKSMISIFAYFSIHFKSKSHTFRHMDLHPQGLARQWPNSTDLFSTAIATRIHLSWSDLRNKCFFWDTLFYTSGLDLIQPTYIL